MTTTSFQALKTIKPTPFSLLLASALMSTLISCSRHEEAVPIKLMKEHREQLQAAKDVSEVLRRSAELQKQKIEAETGSTGEK